MFMKLGVGVVYKTWSKREIRETRSSDSDTLLKGVNTFLSILATFLDKLTVKAIPGMSVGASIFSLPRHT
jgi:hypothetical protein